MSQMLYKGLSKDYVGGRMHMSCATSEKSVLGV